MTGRPIAELFFAKEYCGVGALGIYGKPKFMSKIKAVAACIFSSQSCIFCS